MTTQVGPPSGLSAFETEVLARLEELSANVVELGAWVVATAFATGMVSGFLLLQILLRAKDSRRVW